MTVHEIKKSFTKEMLQRAKDAKWDEDKGDFVSPLDNEVPVEEEEGPDRLNVQLNELVMVKFGKKKTTKKGGGKEVPKRPSTMQDPNFNGNESDSVATGEAEVAAARLWAAMKGAQPKKLHCAQGNIPL